MYTRRLLISSLMLVCLLLSACAPAATAVPTAIPPTAIPPTDTALPTSLPVIQPTNTATITLPPSDGNALATVAGTYSYRVGRTFNFILNTDGSYNSLASSGKFTVTSDQITFADNSSDCASQLGVYAWSLGNNNILHLTPTQDDCQRRANVFGSQEFAKEPATLTLPSSDPKSLALLAGNYLYKEGGESFQFNLFSNESFISIRNSDGHLTATGAISVTTDQITFAGYDYSCESEVGAYKWSLSNNILQLTLIKDDCKRRMDSFATQAFEKVPASKTSATIVWETPATVNGNGIAADSLGNVYVADGSASFFKYDINGTRQVSFMGSWVRGLSYTTGIAVDSQGNIYVANFDPPAIHKFTQDGNPVLTWAIADGVGPVGLAVDSQGNVYVALHRIHDHYIEKYDPQGKLLGTWAKPESAGGQIVAGPRSGPGFMAVDENGDNYITDAGEQVHKYDKDGKFLYDIPHPGSITMDMQGNLYLFVSEDSSILKYDRAGKQIGAWSISIPGIIPGYSYGLVVDKNGDILLYSETVLAKIKLPGQ